jgi:uncharacterized membrane protein
MGVYSPEDYVICIAILLFILWFLFRCLFSKIGFDRDFIKAISPYILIGIFIRLLVDVGFLEGSRLWNVTPGVYILSITLGLVSVGLGLYLSRSFRIPYWYLPLGMGVLILLPITYTLFSHLTHPERILYPLTLASLILLLVYLPSRYLRVEIFRRGDNLAIIFSHLLDGCATYIALNNYPGFEEEHLLPIYLISIAGGDAFIMVPVKLALILLVLYLIEKWYVEEKKRDELLYRVIKTTIFIFGIGPGLRDTLLPALVS